MKHLLYILLIVTVSACTVETEIFFTDYQFIKNDTDADLTFFVVHPNAALRDTVYLGTLRKTETWSIVDDGRVEIRKPDFYPLRSWTRFSFSILPEHIPMNDDKDILSVQKGICLYMYEREDKEAVSYCFLSIKKWKTTYRIS